MPRNPREPGWVALTVLLLAVFTAGALMAIVVVPHPPAAPTRPVVYVNPTQMPVMELAPCDPDSRIYVRSTAPPAVVAAARECR